MKMGQRVRELIATQGVAWEAVRDQVDTLAGPGPVLAVGSGSSYYLAVVVAEVAARLGLKVHARVTSDVVLESDPLLNDVSVVVIVSRSGATTEAVWAAEESRRRGKRVVAVTCNRESPLARLADARLVSPLGEDGTVVMVRSFTSMLVLMEQVLAVTAGLPRDPITAMAQWLPAVGEAAEKVARRLVAGGVRRVYLLGGGVRYGIALEGALKVQEMSLGPVAAYAPLEFRHGPSGSVASKDLLVFLGQRQSAHHEVRVLREFAQQDVATLVVAPAGWAPEDVLDRITGKVDLPAEIPDLWAGPLATVPLQVLAWHLAVAGGQDPDHPRNLSKVVSLDYR